MNSDTQPMNTSKYEKLGKEPNTQIKHNKCNNPGNPPVTDAHQIFDNLNQSIQRKQKPDASLISMSQTSSSTKHIDAVTGKHQAHKLVDSKQVSGPFQQLDKKTFLLDTYARIVARNNRRCPKRLHELAKPKRQVYSDQTDYAANFNLNYGHVTKPNLYHTEDKRNLKESKKK